MLNWELTISQSVSQLSSMQFTDISFGKYRDDGEIVYKIERKLLLSSRRRCIQLSSRLFLSPPVSMAVAAAVAAASIVAEWFSFMIVSSEKVKLSWPSANKFNKDRHRLLSQTVFFSFSARLTGGERTDKTTGNGIESEQILDVEINMVSNCAATFAIIDEMTTLSAMTTATDKDVNSDTINYGFCIRHVIDSSDCNVDSDPSSVCFVLWRFGQSKFMLLHLLKSKAIANF